MALVRFFSFRSRSAVPRWLAWFALTLGIAWLGAYALTKVEGIALVAVYTVLGIATAKLATESVRRLHDCGQSGWLGLAVAAGIVALLVTACLHWLGYGADPVFWGALGLATIATAALLLRGGTNGANAYGPPPAPSPFTAGDGEGKAGIIVAVAFLIVGIATGSAVLAWQAEMMRAREGRVRHMENYVAPPNLFPGEDEASAKDGNDA